MNIASGSVLSAQHRASSNYMRGIFVLIHDAS
jgi:hypothetical protein